SVKPQTAQHYWCSIALIFTPR
ncbi:glyoxalase/dioxygenase family protein, partial [Vibrio parahaemolyticus VP2007-007]